MGRFFAYAQNDSWVERRTRKRAKKENQQEEQREKNQKEEKQRRGTKKKETTHQYRGKLILAGGKLKAGRSLEVVGDAEGGGEDTVV